LAKRHEFRPGDWQSVAVRLDEIISAASGEDAFEEAFKLLVAKLAHERGGFDQGFLDDEARALDQGNRLLAEAAAHGLIEPGSRMRLRAPELSRCAAVLGSVRLLSQDLVGLDAIFEFMVNKAAKGQKGQYFTPRHVVAEVVQMLQPSARQWVADPACGSGGFLRHALLAAGFGALTRTRGRCAWHGPCWPPPGKMRRSCARTAWPWVTPPASRI
jgi:type I restriction enzyme M protein